MQHAAQDPENWLCVGSEKRFVPLKTALVLDALTAVIGQRSTLRKRYLEQVVLARHPHEVAVLLERLNDTVAVHAMTR